MITEEENKKLTEKKRKKSLLKHKKNKPFIWNKKRKFLLKQNKKKNRRFKHSLIPAYIFPKFPLGNFRIYNETETFDLGAMSESGIKNRDLENYIFELTNRVNKYSTGEVSRDLFELWDFNDSYRDADSYLDWFENTVDTHRDVSHQPFKKSETKDAIELIEQIQRSYQLELVDILDNLVDDTKNKIYEEIVDIKQEQQQLNLKKRKQKRLFKFGNRLIKKKLKKLIRFKDLNIIDYSVYPDDLDRDLLRNKGFANIFFIPDDDDLFEQFEYDEINDYYADEDDDFYDEDEYDESVEEDIFNDEEFDDSVVSRDDYLDIDDEDKELEDDEEEEEEEEDEEEEEEDGEESEEEDEEEEDEYDFDLYEDAKNLQHKFWKKKKKNQPRFRKAKRKKRIPLQDSESDEDDYPEDSGIEDIEDYVGSFSKTLKLPDYDDIYDKEFMSRLKTLRYLKSDYENSILGDSTKYWRHYDEDRYFKEYSMFKPEGLGKRKYTKRSMSFTNDYDDDYTAEKITTRASLEKPWGLAEEYPLLKRRSSVLILPYDNLKYNKKELLNKKN